MESEEAGLSKLIPASNTLKWVARGVLSAGSVAAAGAGMAYLFRVQGRIARRAIGKPLGEIAYVSDRTYKKKRGSPIRLLLMGDSIAAGLGASTPKQTLGARLAKDISRETGRAVKLRTAAIVGSESSSLPGQLDSLPSSYRPDVAVIVTGGNDVTHLIKPTEAVVPLAQVIARLQALGCVVVVGTCPNLGVLPAVPQPLRSVGGLASRRMAAAQTQTALDAGAIPVSLARTIGPLFLDHPEEMFAEDRFHPSSLGYRRSAKALLPAVLTALGAANTAELH